MPPDPTPSRPIEDFWASEGAKASSILRFRKNVQDKTDDLMIAMVSAGQPIGFLQLSKTETASGRPVVVLLGVGEEVVKQVVRMVQQHKEE